MYKLIERWEQHLTESSPAAVSTEHILQPLSSSQGGKRKPEDTDESPRKLPRYVAPPPVGKPSAAFMKKVKAVMENKELMAELKQLSEDSTLLAKSGFKFKKSTTKAEMDLALYEIKEKMKANAREQLVKTSLAMQGSVKASDGELDAVAEHSSFEEPVENQQRRNENVGSRQSRSSSSRKSAVTGNNS